MISLENRITHRALVRLGVVVVAIAVLLACRFRLICIQEALSPPTDFSDFSADMRFLGLWALDVTMKMKPETPSKSNLGLFIFSWPSIERIVRK